MCCSVGWSALEGVLETQIEGVLEGVLEAQPKGVLEGCVRDTD